MCNIVRVAVAAAENVEQVRRCRFEANAAKVLDLTDGRPITITVYFSQPIRDLDRHRKCQKRAWLRVIGWTDSLSLSL